MKISNPRKPKRRKVLHKRKKRSQSRARRMITERTLSSKLQ
jgi:hypothetical protein